MQRINHLVNWQAEVRSQRYQGRIETVLVEAVNPKDPEQVMGRTRGNRLTFFPGDINLLKGENCARRYSRSSRLQPDGDAL